MEIISLSISIQKVESMADRSLKLIMYTQELWPEDMSKLFTYNQKQCFALIGENPIMEIPKELESTLWTSAKEWKSPSQRLRNALYRLWEQDNIWLQFETFYKDRMDKLTNNVISKLL